MKIERVKYEENHDKSGKKINKKKVDKLIYLIYLVIASLIIPFGFFLAIYVLFKTYNKKVKGNVKIAKIISWFQIGLTLLGFYFILFFPKLIEPFMLK